MSERSQPPEKAVEEVCSGVASIADGKGIAGGSLRRPAGDPISSPASP